MCDTVLLMCAADTRGCSSDPVWRRSEPSTTENSASEFSYHMLFDLPIHHLIPLCISPSHLRFISIPLHFRGVTEAASPAQTIFPRMVLRNSSGLSTVYRKVWNISRYSQAYVRKSTCILTTS